MDAVETVYLWFGWWPDDEEGTEASNSRRRRWDEERRKAMESAVSYAKGNLFAGSQSLLILNSL